MRMWLRIFPIICLLLIINFRIYNCFRPYRLNKSLKEPSNVPIRTDLNTYLNIIKKVTSFFYKNVNEVDINVYFGIFLTNVNLKHALKKERWHFTGSSRDVLNEVVDLNAKILIYFLDNVRKQSRPENREAKMIFKLFSNKTRWMNKIDNFNLAKLETHIMSDEIQYILSDWKRYTTKIDAVEDDIPSPEKSDECLASLADSPVSRTINLNCIIDVSCQEVLRNGTNYGYALTHRLLFLLVARFTHDCTIFSAQEDQYLSNRFCSMLYVEAEFIASHSFGLGLVDLMLETMCLCALNGHAQFLHRSWLDKISHYQTPAGCFGDIINDVNYIHKRQKSRKWKLNRSRDQDILEGRCNAHATTLAVATYSEAVRFILEMYY